MKTTDVILNISEMGEINFFVGLGVIIPQTKLLIKNWILILKLFGQF